MAVTNFTTMFWGVPSKEHCLMVINGSEGEVTTRRWPRASGGRGGPLACRRWNNLHQKNQSIQGVPLGFRELETTSHCMPLVDHSRTQARFACIYIVSEPDPRSCEGLTPRLASIVLGHLKQGIWGSLGRPTILYAFELLSFEYFQWRMTDLADC